jgi:hypothetical protein
MRRPGKKQQWIAKIRLGAQRSIAVAPVRLRFTTTNNGAGLQSPAA